MNLLDVLYRWSDDFGGGLVIATSIDEAKDMVVRLLGDKIGGELKVWPWKDDDYFNEDHPGVMDIYGCRF